jgi:Tol biopolymer transport system component
MGRYTLLNAFVCLNSLAGLCAAAVENEPPDESLLLQEGGRLCRVTVVPEGRAGPEIIEHELLVTEWTVTSDARWYAYAGYPKDVKRNDYEEIRFGPGAWRPPWSPSPDFGVIEALALSPDRSKLLIVEDPQASGPMTRNLWRVDLTTDEMELWRSGGIVVAPAWSPDGTRVAFYYADSSNVFFQGGFKLGVMDADGQNEQQLAGPSLHIRFTPDREPPLWLPSGRTCLFEAGYDPEKPIPHTYAVDLDTEVVTLVHEGLCDSVSPDGTKIYLTSTPGLLSMRPDGTHIKGIEGPSGAFREGIIPRISPSGAWLAFITMVPGGLHVVAANGGESRMVAPRAPHPPRAFHWIQQSLANADP